MALKVGELFASFNLDTSGVASAVSDAEKQLSNLGKNLAIGGAAMTAAVTVPVTKAATEIYEAGSGFDAQMSKVFAIIGEEATGSAEVMEALRNEALEMGSTTAFTASEAGEAMQYMAMAGWKVDDMLAGLSPIMDLAAASGESLGTVSDIVTDALTAFGLTAEDTAHFTDVLAAASSNSNTNVAIMGESFKYAAPLAGSLGYSVDDVAVALGLMANAGIKGSMAGTSLRQVLSNLISPTDAQAEAMEALGISLYDSNGKVKSLAELMGDMRKAASESGFDMQALQEQVAALDEQLDAGTLTQEEYDAQVQALTEGNGEFLKAISDLAGARGLSGLLAIMNATEEDFQSLTEAVAGSTGAAKTMAQVMLDNAQGDVTLFKSALEGLEITLWGLGEDGFRSVVQKATELVNSFREADSETQSGALRFAALAAAAGPVMAALGGIITLLPKLASTFTVVSGPGAMLAIGLIALGAAAIDSGNSMGKTFVKGATAAGNKVRQLGKDVKKQLPTLTKNMGEFLKSLSTGIEQGLPGIMEGITDILTTGISAIAGNMGNIADVAQTIVRTLADGIVNNMPEMVASGLELLTELAAAFITNIPVVQESIARVMTSVIGEVNNANWSEIGTKLNGALQESLDATGVWFRQLAMGDQYTEGATWTDVGFALANNVLSGIQQAFGNVKDFVGSLLLGDTYDPDEDWSTFGGKIIDKVFEGVDGAVSGAAGFVSGILDGLAGVFTEENISAASSTLSSIVSRLITAAANEIPKLVEHAGTILTKIGELIFGKEGEKGLAASALEGAGNLAKAIIDAIVAALPDVENAGFDLLDTLAGILSESNIQDFMDGASSLATNLLSAITTAIGGLSGMAADLLSAIGDALFSTNSEGEKSLVASAIEGAGNLATNLIQAIIDSIPGIETAAEEIITAIAGILAPGNINNVGEATQTLAGNILTGIANGIRVLGTSAASILTAICDALFQKDENGDSIVTAGVTALTGIVQTIFDTITDDIIPALADSAAGIFSAIGTALSGFDWANAVVDLTSLGTAIIDAIVAALNGIGAVGSSIIEAVGTLLENINWDEVSVSLDGFADMLLNGIKKGIDALATVSVDLITALGNLFTRINWEDVSSFTSNLASTLIYGIYKGINEMTTGASQILEAVSNLLKKIDWTEAATTVSSLAQTIFDGITEGAKTLVPNMTDLISAIGRGISAAAGGLGEFAGTIVGNLVAFMLSPENWLKLIELGATLVEGIATGIINLGGSILEGAWNAVTGFFTGLFKALGLMPTDELNEFTDGLSELSEEEESALTEHLARDVIALNGFNEQFGEAIVEANQLYSEISDIFNQESTGSPFIKMLAAVGYGSAGADLLDYLIGDTTATADAVNEAYIIVKGQADQLYEVLLDGEQSAADARRTILRRFQTDFSEDFVGALLGQNMEDIAAAFTLLSYGVPEEVVAALDIPGLNDRILAMIADNGISLSNIISALMNDGTSASTISMVNGYEAAAREVEEVVEEYVSAASEAAESAASSAQDAYTLALQTLPDVAAITGEDAAKGMADGIDNNASSVELSMEQLSDSVVRAALEQMTYATGYSTGYDYAEAIGTGISDYESTISSIATKLATFVYTTVFGILSSSKGYSIGRNFGSGLANGISSMTSVVYSAAWNLGITAANALSSAIDEGSPSRVTAESGANFGLGFIGSILDSVEGAEGAASLMGSNAAHALEKTVSSIQSLAADGMSVPVTYRQSEEEQRAAQSEKAMAQYANAIARALNGAKVQIDGEDAGRLIMPTVSELIAAEADLKRWGTE